MREWRKVLIPSSREGNREKFHYVVRLLITLSSDIAAGIIPLLIII